MKYLFSTLFACFAVVQVNAQEVNIVKVLDELRVRWDVTANTLSA
ncbi:MAG: hypothetical protein ACJAZM_000915 [Cyclobacteriaceae bacterium]|jgi:hypothetical protein